MRISAFWQACLIVVLAYLVFDKALPPLMPKSLMLMYMSITTLGVLLYFSFDDRRWQEFLAPLRRLIHHDGLWPGRWALLLGLPILTASFTYGMVSPQYDPPVELRQVHPAPPSKITVYDKQYDLTTLQNPLRLKVVDELGKDPQAAWASYRDIVRHGREVYYQNCFYCHGDLQEGHGIFAKGLNPPPANFRDVGTIAQLQEAYLFWRITSGGPGLPKESAPWNSAMPVWHEMLNEEQVWQVITFLYDRVGQVPRMWDPRISKAVTGMMERISAEREKTLRDPNKLYAFYCSACHGEKGAGDGPAAKFLYPAPRDFRSGFFKYKKSPSATALPTDDDLLHTVRDGLEGTAMPAWGELLSDEQIKSLIPVIKRFDQVGSWAPKDAKDSDFDADGRYLGQPISVSGEQDHGSQVPFSPESVAKGRKLFLDTCAQCHGDDGRGNPNPDKRLKDEWGSRIWPRDLTKPWTWRMTNAAGDGAASRNKTIANIFTRLSVGIPGTPMPAHAKRLSEEKRWHIANYVYTLRDYTPPPAGTPVIRAHRIETSLPESVDDPDWGEAQPATLMMLPNIIKEGRLFKSLSDALTVRVLYNDRDVAFLLELDDRTMSRPGDPDAQKTQDTSRELFPDAFAIELPKAGAFKLSPVVEKPLYRHGDARHATTIWYWNAGSENPEKAPYAMLLDATGVDRKMQPRPDDHSLTASGQWVAGRWRVMMKRPRHGGDGDVDLEEGRFVPIAFANWDGSNGESGSKHTLTSWYWLLLPTRADPVKTVMTPTIAAFLVFSPSWWWLALARRRRKQAIGSTHREKENV